MQRDFLPRQLEPELGRTGVNWSVAVEARLNYGETLSLLRLADESPFIAGVVGWLDLFAEDVEAQLARFTRNPKLVGLRHRFPEEVYGEQLLSSEFKRGIGHLEKWGLTYDLLAVEKQLPSVLRFVEQFPSQPFVLDHIAKPLIKAGSMEPWQTHIRELARHPQVYCKLSGLVTEADWSSWKESDIRPYLDVVFKAFGSRRLMWGSDWPVCLVAGSYSRVFALIADYVRQFNEEEQARIMGLNARDFYKLSL